MQYDASPAMTLAMIHPYNQADHSQPNQSYAYKFVEMGGKVRIVYAGEGEGQ